MAIIQDLQGPRIRVGLLPKEGIEVHTGQVVRLRTSAPSGDLRDTHTSVPAPLPEIPVTYASLTRDLHVGSRVLINDGLIELQAVRIADNLIDCSVLTGGAITSHKGINLPGTVVSAPTLTEKDREDIRFGVEHGVDYLALSFVTRATGHRGGKDTGSGMRKHRPNHRENRTGRGHCRVRWDLGTRRTVS